MRNMYTILVLMPERERSLGRRRPDEKITLIYIRHRT
jgi:hypothetical protein